VQYNKLEPLTMCIERCYVQSGRVWDWFCGQCTSSLYIHQSRKSWTTVWNWCYIPILCAISFREHCYLFVQIQI